jgi:hypothetical protein
MSPTDPNFPEEIPPVPEPRSEDGNQPGGNKPLSDRDAAMPSAEVGALPPDEPWAETEDWTDPDVWTETDLVSPQTSNDTPRKSPTRGGGSNQSAEPQPSARGKGSAGNYKREAEKPVNVAEPYDDWGQADVPYQPKELGVIDQILLVLADGVNTWRRLMRWVRSQLPPTWQRQMSEELLTAISLGLLILFLVIWNPLGLGRQANQSVAQQPEAVEEQPSEVSPVLASGNQSETASDSAGMPDSEPTMSPEQSLIADIQDQVTKISRSYASGLIQSVEVNLPENRLIVNVGENWYGLMHSQQDVISQDILDQASSLDFKTLELRDPEGTLVARNAVVGQNMVILWRQRTGEGELFTS